MSADLTLHVMTPELTEDDVHVLLGGSLGSKWFTWAVMSWNQRTGRYDAVLRKASETPQVHVGEVSWLKAALTEDPDTYVPDVVQAVSDIVGEDLPVIDDALISRVAGAFDVPNRTEYSVSDGRAVVAWLHEHRGERVFTLSW